MSFKWSTGRYYWDFADSGTDDVSVLGTTGASVIQQTNGISIIQTASSDVKARLTSQRGCTYNSTVTADITCVSGSGNIGFCWRTTSFNTANDSYSWYFGISKTGWTLGTGSNSTSPYWTQRASGTGSYTGRHLLKVILNATTITCYIDNVQVYSGSQNYYNIYGFIMPRSYMGDADGRLHSLEILDNMIHNPLLSNINAFVKVVFDRDVHFPYSKMRDYAYAFTTSFQQRDFYHNALYTKTVTAVDIVHAKDSSGNNIMNTVIVKFSLDDDFRKAESDITLHFDSSKCMIYGAFAKDKLQNFNLSFTAQNIDHYQQPNSIEAAYINCNVNNVILSIPVVTIALNVKSEAAYIVSSTGNMIVPTLTGTIKP